MATANNTTHPTLETILHYINYFTQQRKTNRRKSVNWSNYSKTLYLAQKILSILYRHWREKYSTIPHQQFLVSWYCCCNCCWSHESLHNSQQGGGSFIVRIVFTVSCNSVCWWLPIHLHHASDMDRRKNQWWDTHSIFGHMIRWIRRRLLSVWTFLGSSRSLWSIPIQYNNILLGRNTCDETVWLCPLINCYYGGWEGVPTWNSRGHIKLLPCRVVLRFWDIEIVTDVWADTFATVNNRRVSRRFWIAKLVRRKIRS